MVIKILAVYNENKKDMPDEKEEKKEEKGEKRKKTNGKINLLILYYYQSNIQDT
jgi:hypothetical protein